MRQAFFYYLMQTWAADPYRQARPDAPAHAPTPAADRQARPATRSARR